MVAKGEAVGGGMIGIFSTHFLYILECSSSTFIAPLDICHHFYFLDKQTKSSKSELYP